jgi:hypothetical protein
LGWDQIEATIIGADNEYEYKLIEISENLSRSDLTDPERTRLKDLQKELRAQRIEHFEKLMRGETPGAPPRKVKGGRGNKGGVRDAARKTGVPKSTAQDRAKPPGNRNPGSLAAATAPKEPAAQPEPAPQPAKSEQPQASAPTAAPDQKVRCPWCGQGWVTPAEAEDIPANPRFEAIGTRH